MTYEEALRVIRSQYEWAMFWGRPKHEAYRDVQKVARLCGLK